MKLVELFYDTETTGLSPLSHGLHQIAGIITVDGVVKEKFNIKVAPNPLAIIEQKALDTAGVTEEQIKAYQPMRAGYLQFDALMSKYVNCYDKQDKVHLIGYNNRRFDDDFLRQWYVQNGSQYFGASFWADSIDVLVLASEALKKHRHTMIDFKLHTVAKTLGIAVDESRLHDAMYDTELTKAIYDEITGI